MDDQVPDNVNLSALDAKIDEVTRALTLTRKFKAELRDSSAHELIEDMVIDLETRLTALRVIRFSRSG